jgi:hypothetical protein
MPFASFRKFAYILLIKWMFQENFKFLKRRYQIFEKSTGFDTPSVDSKPDFPLCREERMYLIRKSGIYMKLVARLFHEPGQFRDRRIFFRILARRNKYPQMTPTCFATIAGYSSNICFTEIGMFVSNRSECIDFFRKDQLFTKPHFQDHIKSFDLKMRHREPIIRVVIDPSLRIIVGGTEDYIYIWSVDSFGNALNTKSMRDKSSCIECLAFYPKPTDSPILVVCCMGTMFFEKISAETLDSKILKRVSNKDGGRSFTSFNFNKDPSFPFFLTASSGINKASLWRHTEHTDDFSMVDCVASLGGHNDSVRFAAFLQTSPNLAVTAGRNDVIVWNVTPHGEVQSLQTLSYCDESARVGIHRIAVNPKLPMIAVGIFRQPTKIFIVLPTGKLVLVAVLEEERCENALAWDVDGNTLAIGTSTEERHPAGFTSIIGSTHLLRLQ